LSGVLAARAGREVELKLEVSARELTSITRHPLVLALAAGVPKRERLRSVYYDTPDLALWRSGLVLRVRAVGRRRIVGVKTRGVVRGGLVVREELEGALASKTSDPRRVSRSALLASIGELRLRRAIEKETSGKRLVPRVETRFQRTTLPLRLGGAALELALDDGEVRAGRSRLPLREIELELRAGTAEALFHVALRLARDCELRPSALGKAERGFARLLGHDPTPSRAEPVPLPPDSSLEVALRAVLAEGLRQLTANQLVAERGEDAEGVHQMRVAARRLRSALRLFDTWLPVRAARLLTGELRWLGRELGPARDLDVFILQLLGPLAERQSADAGIAALRQAAESARGEAYDAVRAALGSRRYTLLVLQLGRFVEGAGLRGSQLAAPARRTLRPLLRERTERMLKLGERLRHLSARELHQLRIRTKRLRYAIELFGALFDERWALRSARRLAALQDALGQLNDLTNAATQLALLRERLGEGASELTARAEGFVLGYAARSAAAGRDTLGEAWQRAARHGLLPKPVR